MMTLCEGLALWHGLPLCVAASADEDSKHSFEQVFYAGDLNAQRRPLPVAVALSDPRLRDVVVRPHDLATYDRIDKDDDDDHEDA